MNLEQLNSFSSFVDDDTLSLENKIKRELYNHLTTAIGSGLFSRGSGSPIHSLENDGNNNLADLLLKVKIVESVGIYNSRAPEELRAIVGAEMIAIKRQSNLVQIMMVFLPYKKPEVKSLDYLVMNVPSFGG